MVYIDELAREQTITVPVSRRNDQRRMNWTLRTAYGRGGAASFYSKQTTPNPELTIFAQALAPILYASSGENLHPPPRPRNRLRQEKPIPVFLFWSGEGGQKTLEGSPCADFGQEWGC